MKSEMEKYKKEFKLQYENKNNERNLMNQYPAYPINPYTMVQNPYFYPNQYQNQMAMNCSQATPNNEKSENHPAPPNYMNYNGYPFNPNMGYNNIPQNCNYYPSQMQPNIMPNNMYAMNPCMPMPQNMMPNNNMYPMNQNMSMQKNMSPNKMNQINSNNEIQPNLMHNSMYQINPSMSG
jgi:hypothetical protein